MGDMNQRIERLANTRAAQTEIARQQALQQGLQREILARFVSIQGVHLRSLFFLEPEAKKAVAGLVASMAKAQKSPEHFVRGGKSSEAQVGLFRRTWKTINRGVDGWLIDGGSYPGGYIKDTLQWSRRQLIIAPDLIAYSPQEQQALDDKWREFDTEVVSDSIARMLLNVDIEWIEPDPSSYQ